LNPEVFIYYSIANENMVKADYGVGPDGPYELTEFKSHEVPFDLGSFERNALSHLGNWKRLKKDDEQFGFYHRLGVKHDIIDTVGNPATVFLHFFAPFTQEGYSMTPEIIETIESRIEIIVNESTIQFAQILDNVIGAMVSAPDYMLEELKQLL
jgi:hypothetical protein